MTFIVIYAPVDPIKVPLLKLLFSKMQMFFVNNICHISFLRQSYACDIGVERGLILDNCTPGMLESLTKIGYEDFWNGFANKEEGSKTEKQKLIV